jgi:hypothetical protein
MNSIERTASTSAEPDLICVEIDRWQSLRIMFDHQGARARIAWKFLVRLALHSYVRFSWVLEYILK